MEIQTPRLCLRTVTPCDTARLKAIDADFKASAFSVYDMPWPEDEAEFAAMVAQFAATELFFMVYLNQTAIGYVCLYAEESNLELAYCIHSAYQGNGFATESCKALMHYAAQHFSFSAFTAGTALANKPSCRVLEKLGFSLKSTATYSFFPQHTFTGGIFEKKVK